MRLSTHIPLSLAAGLVLSGCAGGFSFRQDRAPDAERVDVAVTIDPGPDVVRPMPRGGRDAAPASALRPRGRTADALDTTTPAQRAAATEAARSSTGQRLGETLAGLGSPGETGFWLVTGLVSRERQGRLVAASGAAVAVELRPSGGPAGSGSRISLAALRALDLPLTELATLQVFALD